VPEAISEDRTLEEAKANVTEALDLALASRRREGEALPARVQVSNGTGHRRRRLSRA
jgi:predicted RNase H-like HicB family nuclease